MRATLFANRPTSIALVVCLVVGIAHALAQSEPPSVPDSLFARAPVLNAPFVADAVTTLVPSNGEARTFTDRYYRDSAGRVRAERRRAR